MCVAVRCNFVAAYCTVDTLRPHPKATGPGQLTCVLQCVAVCCNVLHWCSVLQCVIVCCRILHCVTLRPHLKTAGP